MADQNLYKKEYVVLFTFPDELPITWDETIASPFDTLEEASENLEKEFRDDERYKLTCQYRIVERETYTRITEQDVDPIWSEEK